MTESKKSRRQEILEALVLMLEAKPCGKITTASLAKQVGVSEAARYRHFPSKSKMFEGLIEFIEEAVFSRVNLIASEGGDVFTRAEKILGLILMFCERNPGFTRILIGDALVGEKERLHQRVAQFFERINTQLKQMFREAELAEGQHYALSISEMVGLMMALVEGKIAQFSRSGFRNQPSADWSNQWRSVIIGLQK